MIRIIAQILYRKPRPQCNWSPKGLLVQEYSTKGEHVRTRFIEGHSELDPYMGPDAVERFLGVHEFIICKMKPGEIVVMPPMYLEPKVYREFKVANENWKRGVK
jgi:hypothetical protein